MKTEEGQGESMYGLRKVSAAEDAAAGQAGKVLCMNVVTGNVKRRGSTPSFLPFGWEHQRHHPLAWLPRSRCSPPLTKPSAPSSSGPRQKKPRNRIKCYATPVTRCHSDQFPCLLLLTIRPKIVLVRSVPSGLKSHYVI